MVDLIGMPSLSSRMQGWHVRAFPELKVYHYRPTSSAEGFPHNWYREGMLDHSLGSHPLFEVFKLVRRIQCKPYVLGAAVQLWAFAWAHARREARCVSPEMMRYLRREQIDRLRGLLSLGHGSLRDRDRAASEGVCK